MTFYLLNRVSMWTGEGAWWLPARRTNSFAVLEFIGKLQQQKWAQASPVNAFFLLWGVAVQEEATALLTENHAVEQEAIFLLGPVANWWPSKIDELNSGQGAGCTWEVLHSTATGWWDIAQSWHTAEYSQLVQSQHQQSWSIMSVDYVKDGSSFMLFKASLFFAPKVPPLYRSPWAL